MVQEDNEKTLSPGGRRMLDVMYYGAAALGITLYAAVMAIAFV
ncbi:MAG: hypothetical protein RQ752_07610 [Thermohalobaculum sp.]|nr:hypothetical protein [Thermohalobaculum sp.]